LKKTRQKVLLPFSQAFSHPGWRYFQGFVWAMLLSTGRKYVSQIGRTCFFVERSLASWERFLAEQQWDMSQVMLVLVGLLQDELGQGLLYAGRDIMGIDPTFVTKAKGRMLGIQTWRQHPDNPDRGVQVVGHQWMLGGLLPKLGEQWRCFPLWFRLVSGKQHPSHFVVSASGQAHPMTIWETALSMILQASSMRTDSPVCVVMDAYFAKACTFNPLIKEGITLLTRLRHDAVGWDDPEYCGRGRPPKRGQKWKFAELWDSTPHETVTVHVYGKIGAVALGVRDVWLRDVSEKVRVVMAEGRQHPILLACTDLSLSAAQILELYAARFSLELAIRDLKGFVGFGDYQSTTTLAFCRFVLLSGVTLCLGRLLLHGKHVDAWLGDLSGAPVSETGFSFARLRRGLRCFVLKRLITV
jgi:hypothetical protein